MKNTVFFDLDSTLLQVNIDDYIEKYKKMVKDYLIKEGYDFKKFSNIYEGYLYNISKNDGSMTNMEFLWSLFKDYDLEKVKRVFYEFHETEFNKLKECVVKTDLPRKIIDILKERGVKLILASTPFYPSYLIERKLEWAGLSKDDFSYIATADNSRYCKPSKEFYLDILNKNNLDPKDCIMVGNDILDDFFELPDGFSKYLIKDYMVNKTGRRIDSDIKVLSLEEFYNYLKK